jgi:adenine-specific DNA-methyltransferase
VDNPNFETAFARVVSLADEFDANKAFYLLPEYNEHQARIDFIDKFLHALGWDVNHQVQKNPFQQEVKVERGVVTGPSERRADYAFFIAPDFNSPRFFVEAKKPFGDLCSPDNCFQAIRYGWNSNVPISALTSFNEFALLDCRYKPDIETAPSAVIERFNYLQYKDADTFRRIYHLFSREEIARGSLDEYSKALPRARGKAMQRRLFKGLQPVDESFLEELDGHRATLAKVFKNHNLELDGDTLTEITQRTLDRLVLIRFLEDKLIESKYYVSEFGSKGHPWREFITLCRRLDTIYNGIVFKRHDILDDPKLGIDESQFLNICRELAHSYSPYDFDSIPIHILGSIYERFLGKVIVTTNKRADVKPKPEVRKAGGVYYTPDYIVRYIVEKSVGKTISGKSPSQIAAMNFADISCGSGSFLLAIFDLLLRYHRDWYNAHPKSADKDGCIKRDDGYWHLSLRQKQMILLANIFGVDIDHQATRVAQLSLYLKLLEEETTASAHQYQREFAEKLLPPLDGNIVCGNSLIETDILFRKLLPRDQERKINAINLKDHFKGVMERGGFDAIVGNPPYGAVLNETEKEYIGRNYISQSYQLDSYLLFIERGIKDLIREGGFLGMIIPNPWLTNLLQKNMRRFIFDKTRVVEIVHFKFPVFHEATVDTQIILLQKTPPESWRATVVVASDKQSFEKRQFGAGLIKLEHDQSRWKKLNGEVVNIFLTESDWLLAQKIKRSGLPLEYYYFINVGIKPYQVGKGTPPQTKKVVEERPYDSISKLSGLYKPYLRGSDINRYEITPLQDRYIKYGPWLAEPRPAAQFDAPLKIFIRQTGDSIIAALDEHQLLCLNNMHVLVPKRSEPDNKFVLGILNSRLMNWYYHTLNPEVGEALAEVKRTNVAALPIKTPDLSNKKSRIIYEDLIRLVSQILQTKDFLSKAHTDKDKEYLKSKVIALDKKVDQFVYELYGLSEEEINHIESPTAICSPDLGPRFV